jgi:hypothetical protein
MIATRIGHKYLLLIGAPPDRLDMMSWPDKAFFVGYAMATCAAIAAIIAEAMFIEPADTLAISAGPVRRRTTAAAKIVAVLLFLTAAAATPALPTALLFGALTGIALQEGIIGIVRASIAHLTALAAAGLWAGCVVLSIHAALAATSWLVVARRAASVLQSVMMMLAPAFVIFAPRAAGWAVSSMRAGVETPPPLVALPTLWFLGLYQRLAGSPAPVFTAHAWNAVIALAAALTLTLVLFAAAYPRIARMAVEGVAGDRALRLPRRHRLASGLMRGRPAARAIFDFTMQTLTRSAAHRRRLAAAAGGAAACIALGIMHVASRDAGGVAFLRPRQALFAMPLVYVFFSALAMRGAVAQPVELRAAWTLRLLRPRRRDVASALRTALLSQSIGPALVLSGLVFGVLWGWAPAVTATVLIGLTGAVICEAAIIGVHAPPFTQSAVVDETRPRTAWPVFVVGLLSVYVYAGLAAPSLTYPPGAVMIATELAAAWLLIRWFNGITGDQPAIGAETADTDVTTLNLQFAVVPGRAEPGPPTRGPAAAPKAVASSQ